MIYHRQDRASCLKLLLSQLWDLKEMPQIVWCWRRWLRWRPWLEEGQASAFLVFTRQSMGLFFSSSAQCIIHSVYIAQCMYVPCLPLDVWCTLLDARSIVPTIFLLQLYSLHVNSGFYTLHWYSSWRWHRNAWIVLYAQGRVRVTNMVMDWSWFLIPPQYICKIAQIHFTERHCERCHQGQALLNWFWFFARAQIWVSFHRTGIRPKLPQVENITLHKSQLRTS